MHLKSLLLAAGCLAFCCAQVLGAQSDSWPLSLAEAQAMALERNHDLHLAHTAISSALANAEVAGAPPNPSLTIATSSISSANNSQGAVWKRPIDTVLHVDQLFERGDK